VAKVGAWTAVLWPGVLLTFIRNKAALFGVQLAGLFTVPAEQVRKMLTHVLQPSVDGADASVGPACGLSRGEREGGGLRGRAEPALELAPGGCRRPCGAADRTSCVCVASSLFCCDSESTFFRTH
jgi:hypothetical protein